MDILLIRQKIVKKYMQRYSVFLVILGMQTKIKMRFRLTPVSVDVTKSKNDKKC